MGFYAGKLCFHQEWLLFEKILSLFVVNVIVSTIFGLCQNFIKVLPDLFSDDLDCHNRNFVPCHILKGWGI